jgi:CheY-like chemotaxis protein
LTTQLLAVSRQQVLELRVVDLREVVCSTAEILERVLGEDVRLFVRGGDQPTCIRADAGQLEQVVMNLALNARDAMPSGGTLVIETQRAMVDARHAHEQLGVKAGPHVRLTVSDTGVGMDEQTQSHIFEPFFTTKETGKGSGLGLATVFGIVQQSRGHIAVRSALGAGTTFELYFPRVDAPAEAASTPPAPTTLRGEETVLLVEDQEEVRLVARAILLHYGYRVLDASTPSAALELCERHDGAIDVLLTDIVMPQMNGRELAEHASRMRPQMRVLLMSGYTEDALVQHGAGGFAYLQKPLVPEVLARRLREVLEARQVSETAMPVKP